MSAGILVTGQAGSLRRVVELCFSLSDFTGPGCNAVARIAITNAFTFVKPTKNSEASPQTGKWLCALNSRFEEIQADAGCSMLDTGYK
jgi:hypothetical protein